MIQMISKCKICVLALMLSICCTVQAQLSNLSMRKVFEKNKNIELVSESEVQGDQLRKYHLSKFHKVKLKVDDKMMAQVESWLAADETKSTEKEVFRDLKHTTYAFFSYKRKDAETAFLLFQYQAKGEEHYFVCFYMEGSTSIKDIKQTFGIIKK